MMDIFSDYTFQVVTLGCIVLGIVSGVLGCFTVLRKQSLLGDCVSHSALPGVVIAFLIIGSKQLEVLLIGAVVSSILAVLLIILITKFSKIKFDSALAILISTFFGFGLVLLTHSQKLSNAANAGLSSFIYGQAASMLISDVILITICSFILIFIVLLFYKEFKAFCFDQQFMKVIGYNTTLLNILLTLLIVLAIVIGLQTVGVILMSAMLVAPALAARQWVNKLSHMILLSAFFGALSSFLGTFTSTIVISMPTGPIIVIYATLIVFISLLIAPNRGIIFKFYRRKKEVIK